MELLCISVGVIAINIMWLCSEMVCKNSSIRILLGVLSIACCYAVAYGAGTLEYMNRGAPIKRVQRLIYYQPIGTGKRGNHANKRLFTRIDYWQCPSANKAVRRPYQP